MTEFLIFLLLSSALIFGLWWVIREGGRIEERDEAQMRAEILEQQKVLQAEYEAKEAERAADKRSPMEKLQDAQDWPKHAFPLEEYCTTDGPIESDPFGVDVANPPSRTIPTRFRGKWKANIRIRPFAQLPPGYFDEILEDRMIFEGETVPVIAVLGDPSDDEIAVVGQSRDEEGWLFSWYSLGLRENKEDNENPLILRDLDDYDLFWTPA